MAILDENAGSWTAAQLLTDVRQKARIPDGALDYNDTVLLEEATRAIWSFAGWAMTKAQDGRLLNMIQRSSTAAFNTQYAPGREFDLPVDSVGDTYDSLFWVSSQGIETRLELIDLFTQPLYDTNISVGEPWGYSISDGRIRLYPKPVAAGTLRINYQKRLPRLFIRELGDEWNVGSSSTTAANLTVGYVDTGGILGAGARVDVISTHYPYRYAVPNCLVTSTGASSFITTSYTSTTCPYPATNELATWTVAVFAGSSPFVHLPLEFKQCLTQKIAAQVLGEIGDAQGAMMLEQKAEAELQRVISMLTPRAKSARQKVVNPFSLLRTGRWSRWG